MVFDELTVGEGGQEPRAIVEGRVQVGGARSNSGLSMRCATPRLCLALAQTLLTSRQRADTERWLGSRRGRGRGRGERIVGDAVVMLKVGGLRCLRMSVL